MNNKLQNGTSREKGGMQVFSGIPVSRGFVAGRIYIFRSVGHDVIHETLIAPSDVADEIRRFEKAMALTRTQLLSLSQALCERISGSAATILESHVMLLDDPVIVQSCKDEISQHRHNAEWTVMQVASRLTAMFEKMEDRYLQERSKDIVDIANRLIRNLQGGGEQQIGNDCPCIIVADELTPSETISLPKEMILGFVTDHGSATSHAALLARALGIPAVCGVGKLSQIAKTGDRILLDGSRGKVVLNPDRMAQKAFDKMSDQSRSMEGSFEQFRLLPALTRDGHPMQLLANTDHNASPANVLAAGADGIGLVRSEYLWLTLNREPTEEEQYEIYRALVDASDGTFPVTIRVLDIGGDKMTSTLCHKEANPFLGNRSIRYLLNTPDVFQRQLRAILRASVHGNISIMYPMVATLEEVRAANEQLTYCMDQLKAEGLPFNAKIRRGVMIEIPAAALIAEALAREVDFFSIGTNDLVQYTLAADRLNESVAHLYQPTHPAVLQLIDMTVQGARKHKRPVAVCGEMACDPIMAVLLVGMGVDQLSMSPNQITHIKYVLRQITLAEAQRLAEQVRTLSHRTSDKIYAYCRNYLLKLVPDLLFL